MKILVFPKYSELGASSRVRMYQYFPELERSGIELRISALLSDNYIRSIYASQKPKFLIIAIAYIKRFFTVLKARNYDLVWVEKELFPWTPILDKLLLKLLGVKYVVDIDDAIHIQYENARKLLPRLLLKNKISRFLSSASLVAAGNTTLVQYAEKGGARNVRYLPTVVDLEEYLCPKVNSQKNDFVIGWIGTPLSQHHIGLIKKPLLSILDSESVSFVTIGTRENEIEHGQAISIPWSKGKEVSELQKIDVGLMPLPDAPFERGKCGYKLIQYMACGKPVIASPVGVNSDLITHGHDGFLAETEDDWTKYLTFLKNDVERREEMGRNARRKIEESYSLQVWSPILVELLHSLVNHSSAVQPQYQDA